MFIVFISTKPPTVRGFQLKHGIVYLCLFVFKTPPDFNICLLTSPRKCRINSLLRYKHILLSF